MSPPTRRDELKSFLRARRAERSPVDAGLPPAGRRLRPGLRREEVAALAGVGIAWYTWLEQGREINISASALSRIAQALGLSRDDERYLFSLAGVAWVEVGQPAEAVHAHLLQAIELYRGPIFALDPALYVLASNRMCKRLYGIRGDEEGFARNHLWNLFMLPERRALYEGRFDDVARIWLSMLRMHAASHSNDVRIRALIEELAMNTSDFSRLWTSQEVSMPSVATGQLIHPEFGLMKMNGSRVFFREPQLFEAAIFILAPGDERTEKIFKRMEEELQV